MFQHMPKNALKTFENTLLEKKLLYKTIETEDKITLKIKITEQMII